MDKFLYQSNVTAGDFYQVIDETPKTYRVKYVEKERVIIDPKDWQKGWHAKPIKDSFVNIGKMGKIKTIKKDDINYRLWVDDEITLESVM